MDCGIIEINPTHGIRKPKYKVRDRRLNESEYRLLGQILRAAREGGGSSSDCALDYAEQQFATVMARSGGLGLARLIVQGLEPHK
jgi:hypothetical protein